MLCPNIPPMLEAHFAVPLAGGVIVAINTRLAADDVAWILEHSGARFLLVDTEFSPLVAPVRDQLPDLRHIVNIVDTGPAPDPARADLRGVPGRRATGPPSLAPGE